MRKKRLNHSVIITIIGEDTLQIHVNVQNGINIMIANDVKVVSSYRYGHIDMKLNW